MTRGAWRSFGFGPLVVGGGRRGFTLTLSHTLSLTLSLSHTHNTTAPTSYTERYMSTPAENPSGYASSSVLTHVPSIIATPLLIHGLIDENVHARHTMRLISALTAAGVRYELLLFPEERHAPRSATMKSYMEARIKEYLAKAVRDRKAAQ
jgi:dipeptidyl aminopeptidase/acylaminoacyl peptidase